MAPDGTHLGGKLKVLRRKAGLTQAHLAERLGISASYLNLIENGRRALTAPLLIQVARIFSLDLAALSGSEDAQVAADLLEVFGDPLFDLPELTAADVRDVASGHPVVARAVIALYRAYQAARETAASLSERWSDGDVAEPGRSPHPADEVTDVLQRRRNHLPDLEAAAERLWKDAALDPGDLYRGLVAHLGRQHGVEVRVQPGSELSGAMRRHDPGRRLLHLSEALQFSSRLFQVAHVIGLLRESDLIDRQVEAEGLASPGARAHLRVALANYYAAAVIMPYDRFLAAAEAERYDLEVLSHRFTASFEQVCHRCTTLARPERRGVPFHLIRVDIAGNVSKRFSASGLRFTRFGASCPLWNVHTAFHTPGRIRVQVSRLPDGSTYLCMARTLRRSGGSYHAPHSLQALALGCDVRHARALVYSDGLDLEHPETAVPVGITCRLCERQDCAQRALPAVNQALRVDEDVRGVSFYAPVR